MNSQAKAGGTLLLILIWSCAAPAHASDRKPGMDPEKPISCVETEEGRELLLQCVEDDGDNCTCLVTGVNILDSSGKETQRRMSKLRGCSQHFHASYPEELEQAGCKMIQAVPDAPEGYARDEKGQIFQVTFDMRRRFYLGSRWSPIFDLDGQYLTRAGFDFGFRTYDNNYSDTRRHRVRLIEGDLSFTPVDFDLLTFGYDLGTKRNRPAFWLTSFIGRPRRHDIHLDLGWGMRLLNVRHHPMRSGRYTDLENLAMYASWEMYHARKLANYVRLTVGPGCGEMLTSDENEDARFTVYPTASFDGEFQIGKRGLHHLGFSVAGDVRYYFGGASGIYYAGRGKLFYEWVVLALNDQPLSLFLEGSAEYREDIPDLPSDLEFRGTAGMRFSFWAPVLRREH